MVTDNRPVVANLDFDSIKSDIIENFKSRSEFADYEFTGSSLNLLIDILAYNTHYYSLASNFAINESFIDSAVLRSSVVSRAKSLNYKPRSVTSAFTTVTLTVTKQSTDDNIVIVPAGSVFTSTASNQTVTFSTITDYVLQFQQLDPVGTTKTLNVVIYEGKYRTERFVQDKDATDFTRFEISDVNCNDQTLFVSVNSVTYKAVLPEDETIFEIGSEDKSYFIEESRNGKPVIVFGNNIIGQALKANDEVLVSYLSSTGSAGNGVSTFSATITGRTDAYVSSVSGPAAGGDEKESIQSVKDNAPKWYQAQYRAVTTNDYEVMLKKKYADIQAISVYGGEEVGYPGQVFICIKPKSGNRLSNATKEIIKKEIIKDSNVVTVRPVMVDPKIFKLKLQTVLVYDKSRLGQSRNVLEAKVNNLLKYLNENYIGDFLSSYRESNLSYEIKNLDKAVVSSSTRVSMTANIGIIGGFLSQYDFHFNNKLYHPNDGFLADKGGILSSSLFYREGRTVQSAFDDDGFGNMRLYDFIDGQKVYVNQKAGRINYTTGLVEFLYEFRPTGNFEINVVTDSNDVIATQDMLLEFDLNKSSVQAVEINETDILKNINLSRSV